MAYLTHVVRHIWSSKLPEFEPTIDKFLVKVSVKKKESDDEVQEPAAIEPKDTTELWHRALGIQKSGG